VRARLRPIRLDRQFRQNFIAKEQQRQQNSANEQEISRHGHFSIAPIRAGARTTRLTGDDAIGS
jgi:hypothetical protein